MKSVDDRPWRRARRVQLGPRPLTSRYRRSMEQTWTLDDLRRELARWERELVAAGKAPNTVATYVGRTEFFLRWLDGTYTPR